mgnify:CR=1 FL=1
MDPHRSFSNSIVKGYNGEDTKGGAFWENNTMSKSSLFFISLGIYSMESYAIVQASGKQFWVEEVKGNGKFGFSIEGLLQHKLMSFREDKSFEEMIDELSLEDLLDKYVTPYKPTDTKPKTDKQQQKSDQSKAELNKQITDFINSDKVEDIKSSSVSKDEAKSRVKQFFS